MNNPPALGNDFTCGWYCNLCVNNYGAQANNPGLLSATLILGHGIMVHGYINGKLNRYLHHDTRWYDDRRDVVPDLVPDDSNSDSGDEKNLAVSDDEKKDSRARDPWFGNIANVDGQDQNYGRFEPDQTDERDVLEHQEHNEADGDEDGDIQQAPPSELPKKKKTSALPRNQALTQTATASNTIYGNQETRNAANFPSITCDRCAKAGKECHMDSYNRICADCDRQAKSCALNGVSCAGLWKEYDVKHPGAKATWVSPVFASAPPERRSGKSQRKEMNGANANQAVVGSIAGKGENKKRKVTGGLDANGKGKETKGAKGMAAGLLGNDA